MQKIPTIEQVWFLSPENKTLIMAGWEFCANAARAAAWQLLDGKEWTTAFAVSWYNGKVYGSVLSNGTVCIELKRDFCLSISIDECRVGLVRLQWITHLVVPMNNTTDQLKDIAKKYLQEFWLLSCDAAGVMFVSVLAHSTSLSPIVRVRGIETFIFESACGSGAIAYALYNYQLTQKKSVSMVQPSWSSLGVTISKDTISLAWEVAFVENI